MAQKNYSAALRVLNEIILVILTLGNLLKALTYCPRHRERERDRERFSETKNKRESRKRKEAKIKIKKE